MSPIRGAACDPGKMGVVAVYPCSGDSRCRRRRDDKKNESDSGITAIRRGQSEPMGYEVASERPMGMYLTSAAADKSRDIPQ